MSIRIMTQVWQLDLPTASHKLLLLAFADHANDEGICYPALESIHRKTGLSRRHTQRLISSLKESGQLLVRRAPTRYTSPLFQVVIGQDVRRWGDILSDDLHNREPSLLTVTQDQAKPESVVVDTTTSLEGGEDEN